MTLRLSGVLMLLVAASACADERRLVAPAPAPPPVQVVGLPPNPAGGESGPPAGTYASATALDYPVQPYTLNSRFVLREDGSFVLQYPHVEYRGTYAANDGTIVFSWEGWSTAGPWGATGTLRDGKLAVRYNTVMQLSDFDNAVYTRIP